MFIILLLLYPLAIQYQRGGAWLVLYPVALVALALDAASNFLEMPLIFWERSPPGEYTCSQRLDRYLGGYIGIQNDWRFEFSRPFAAYLNFFMPRHIKNYF